MSRRGRIGLVAGLGVLIAGCAQDAPQDTWDPAGPNAQKINDLDWVVYPIAGVVGLIVFGVIAFVVIRFRDRGQAIPEQTHGEPALEITLTIIPALILIGIAIPSVSTLMALNDTEDTECIVNVTGQQWWWEVDYAQQDGCGGIPEPIITSGQMVIPTGTPVLVRGTSRDVIHSWWIPRLNGKRRLVPTASTPCASRPTSRASTPASAPSSADCHREQRAWRSSPSPPRTSRPGRHSSSRPTRRPGTARSPRPARRPTSLSARAVTRSTASKTPTVNR